MTLEEVRAARDLAAVMVIDDEAYVPIFDRLDREVMACEANDPVARARALAAGLGKGNAARATGRSGE